MARNKVLSMLRTLSLSLTLAAVGILAAGCGEDHAQMRFVHAVPDAPNVDVALDSDTVITNLAFDNPSPATGYLTVIAGNRLIEVRPTGTTTDEVNAPNVGFGTHKQYTVFFTGRLNDPPPPTPTQTINLVTDDNSAPQNGGIKLRVFHASPGATPTAPARLDIYVVAPGTDITSLTPTIGGLTFQQASGYLNLAAASYEVIVTDPTDNAKTRLVDQTYNLAAGQIRTLVMVDALGGGAISPTPLPLQDVN